MRVKPGDAEQAALKFKPFIFCPLLKCGRCSISTRILEVLLPQSPSRQTLRKGGRWCPATFLATSVWSSCDRWQPFFSERQAAAWTHRQLLESDGSDGPKIQVSLATLGPWVRRVRALWQTRPCTAPFSSAQRIVDMSAFDSKGFPSVSSFLHSENRACVA